MSKNDKLIHAFNSIHLDYYNSKKIQDGSSSSKLLLLGYFVP